MPMLMNVAEHHQSYGRMLLHQIHEAVPGAKGHGTEGRFTDGRRGVMESQKDRPLAFGKPHGDREHGYSARPDASPPGAAKQG